MWLKIKCQIQEKTSMGAVIIMSVFPFLSVFVMTS